MMQSGVHQVQMVFLLLLLFVVVFAAVARKLQTPYPIVLVIAGLLLGLVPGIHKIALNPDLIFLDIGLPELNGIEACHRMSSVVPAAKIIFVTQNNDAETVRAALSNGASGYVLKLDANNELLPAVEAVLQGDRFVSTRVKHGGGIAPSG